MAIWAGTKSRGGGDDAEVMGGSENDAVFEDLGNDRVIGRDGAEPWCIGGERPLPTGRGGADTPGSVKKDPRRDGERPTSQAGRKRTVVLQNRYGLVGVDLSLTTIECRAR